MGSSTGVVRGCVVDRCRGWPTFDSIMVDALCVVCRVFCPSLPVLMQHGDYVQVAGRASARNRRRGRAIGSRVFPEVIGGRGADWR